MASELISTKKTLLALSEQCNSNLLNAAFEEVAVIWTNLSNYWNATSFILDESKLSRINKIQVVTLFLICGGVVEFDLHLYNRMESEKLWRYLVEHKFITEEEYDKLSQFERSEKVTFI